ncbi:MAG: methyltransferase [Amphritea sp.]
MPITSHTSCGRWRDRFQQLDKLLMDTQPLWRPQPFKEVRPQWCQQYPQLTSDLLQINDKDLARLQSSTHDLQQLLGSYLPELQALPALTELSVLPRTEMQWPANHFFAAIPGRKRAQIEAFTATIGKVHEPIVEWCGGKGHLGRLLAMQWRTAVTTLEWNSQLCKDGARRADKAGVAQQFEVMDVLAPQRPLDLHGKHAVALHACGVLHRTLGQHVTQVNAPALDIAPCCYAVGVEDKYQSFTALGKLKLSRDDLRLAVTETVTAGSREVRLRDTEMAWKLGFNLLRAELFEESAYHSMKPISKGWLKMDFAGFCRQLALREGIRLPDTVHWADYEASGWQRQREVMRLLLVRSGFRRALELWLVLDMVCWLELNDYRVELGTFCERQLTPRNILISARRE